MNNIEINDKLEIDIENKYIKYKENVKFTTEEAIYILKRKDFCDEVENIAIENLIQENKELKDTNKKLYELCQGNAMQEFINNKCGFIPKSKVKDYLNKMEKRCNKPKFSVMKKDIEKLLEEGE